MKTFLIIFFILIFNLLYSQKKYTWGIEARPKIGFLAAHNSSMAHVPNKQAFAQEISFFIQTNGRKNWHKNYKYPLVGITYFSGSLGNDQILGRFNGIYQFIEFPFIHKKKYRFLGKLANGLAYTPKHYDPITNSKNNAIGSHVNALICFGLINRLDINNHHFSFGIDITHCSNAAAQTPNLGVNLPFLSLGYGYTIHQNNHLDSTKIGYHLPFKKFLFSATSIISEKEIYPTQSRKYAVFSLSANTRYFFKPRVGCELAFDFFSKQSTFGYKTDIKKTQLDIIQLGVFAGYLLPLDNFHFVLGMGVYVRDKYKPDDLFYHRVGMRYYLNNGLFFNVVLKSHWAKADYFESGIGYTLNYKK